MGKQHILGALVGILVILWIFWAGGYDFNERGVDAVFCTMFSIGGGALGVIAVKAMELE